MARAVKCFECKWNVEKDGAISVDGHYYHTACYQKVLDRKELFTYVCKLFGLKTPGPVIYSQRKSFAEKYGYTDAGMLKTLIYLYDVKKTKIDGAQQRIGLIPYAYEEAQEYFTAEEKRKQEITQRIAENIKTQKIEIIHIKPPQPKRSTTPFIDPESLYNMNDEE